LHNPLREIVTIKEDIEFNNYFTVSKSLNAVDGLHEVIPVSQCDWSKVTSIVNK
jgi:hypothetical protein